MADRRRAVLVTTWVVAAIVPLVAGCGSGPVRVQDDELEFFQTPADFVARADPDVRLPNAPNVLYPSQLTLTDLFSPRLVYTDDARHTFTDVAQGYIFEAEQGADGAAEAAAALWYAAWVRGSNTQFLEITADLVVAFPETVTFSNLDNLPDVLRIAVEG
ncbi:MAG: hypothetical protein ACRD0U_09490, partial [Acidimicrobiales bacterium]